MGTMSTVESALSKISSMWNPIVEVTNLLENDNLRLLFEDEKERTKRKVVSLILVILSVDMILLSTGVILDFLIRNMGEESIIPVGYSAIFILMILVYNGLSSPDVFTKDKTVQRISRKATPYLCFSFCFTIMIAITPGDRFTMLPAMGILALLSPIMPSIIIVRELNKRQVRVWFETKHKNRYYYYTRKGEYCYCGTKATINQNGNILRLFLWSDFVSKKYELHIENKTEVKERITAILNEIKRGVEESNSEIYANQNQTSEIKKLISQLEEENANKSIYVEMTNKLDSFNGILNHIVEQPVQAQEQTNQQQEIINKLEELMRLVEALNNEMQE
ncbi:hypothetical protein HMPREF9623_01541 [Stomatobaculum longum]|uniref:Uncharacterized protein n=2 Tax=Stomatobaculum longum TaxID=796942 RepID=A0AA36Y453_9FIRM|nr:hypothetical protein HMPREF9623_01541 [Stomatobaculum longum]